MLAPEFYDFQFPQATPIKVWQSCSGDPDHQCHDTKGTDGA